MDPIFAPRPTWAILDIWLQNHTGRLGTCPNYSPNPYLKIMFQTALQTYVHISWPTASFTLSVPPCLGPALPYRLHPFRFSRTRNHGPSNQAIELAKHGPNAAQLSCLWRGIGLGDKAARGWQCVAEPRLAETPSSRGPGHVKHTSWRVLITATVYRRLL